MHAGTLCAIFSNLFFGARARSIDGVVAASGGGSRGLSNRRLWARETQKKARGKQLETTVTGHRCADRVGLDRLCVSRPARYTHP